MELQDSVLKEFADAVNNNSLVQPSDSQHLYATVSRNVEGTGDLVYVRLNGSEIDTPARSLVKVGVGDVVMCTMRGHTLTIIGNVSYPALTRIENVYMTLTAEGLMIGRLNSENKPYESYIVVGPSSSNIYNIDGTGKGILVASFGETVQVGKSSQSHVVITDVGVEIQNGQNKTLAKFSSSGIQLNDSNGVTIAEFGTSTIAIGKSTSATITFCGGKAVISLDSDSGTLKITGGNSVEAIGISNTYNNRYRSEVVCEAKNSSPRAAVQLFDNNTAISSMVLSKDGANFTLPNSKVLSENGQEVAKLNDILAVGAIKFSGSIPAATANITVDNKPHISPAAKDISVTVTGIPSGYTLCGIRGITMTNAGFVFLGRYRGVLSGGKILVTLLNINLSSVSVNGFIYWFAIKTTAIKTVPDQTIDW